MTVLATVLVLVAGGSVLAVWLSRVLDRLLATRNTEMDGRLQAMNEIVDRRLAELDTKVDRRLEHATKQTNAIHEKLGAVGEVVQPGIPRGWPLLETDQLALVHARGR